MVHLIECRRRKPKCQPQQCIFQRAISNKCFKAVSENDVALFRVVIDDNPADLRHLLADCPDKRLFFCKRLSVDDQAKQNLRVLACRAQIDMPDHACVRPLVIRRNIFFFHPAKHRFARPIGAFRLNFAVCDGNDCMAACPIKARNRLAVLRLHRKLHLVAVAVHAPAAGDLQVRKFYAADARQCILHAAFFLLQLASIVHVPEHAAAAAPKIRALRLHAMRRCLHHTHEASIRAGSSDVVNFDLACFPRNHARHKHDLSVNTRHTRALGSQAGNFRTVGFVFLHCFLSVFHVKHFTHPIVRRFVRRSGRHSHAASHRLRPRTVP